VLSPKGRAAVSACQEAIMLDLRALLYAALVALVIVLILVLLNVV
jgi:hypothetical protein